MNYRGLVSLALTFLFAAAWTTFGPDRLLGAAQIGQKVPDFRLPDTSGRMNSLGEYLAAGKVVVLDFWSFKCSVSLAYNDRLAALQEKYRYRGVVVVAVASNANESAAEVERNAGHLSLPFPVLLDKGGALAEQLQATHTPHLFVIDRDGILRYRGTLDNNKQPGESGRIAYVEDALESILAGRPVVQPETRPIGCSIKRKAF